MEKELVTTAQAAAIRGCTVRTVHRMVQRGALHPVQQFPGYRGAYLFDRAAVAAAKGPASAN